MRRGIVRERRGLVRVRRGLDRVRRGLVRVRRGLDRVRRGLVYTVASRTAVRQSWVRFPRSAPLPRKTSSPAQIICAAQENHPSEENLMRINLVRILYCKRRKNK